MHVMTARFEQLIGKVLGDPGGAAPGGAGPATSHELAQEADPRERSIREWLAARTRLRTVLAAVAVAGFLVVGEPLRQRRVRYLRSAEWYARMEQNERELMWRSEQIAEADRRDAEATRARAEGPAADPEPGALRRVMDADARQIREDEATRRDRSAEVHSSVARSHAEWAEFWSRLRGRCERAARYPWLPVAPDPHPPG
jgi:hypothetical protein